MREQLLSRVPHGLSLLATLLIAAGCAVGPVYERPNAATPATFKEAVTTTAVDAGSWKAAQPSEEVARGRWWTVFGDPRLDDLEQQALDANQNLKAAAARLKQARALAQAAHADLLPSLDAGLGATRQRQSPVSQRLPDNAAVPAQTFYRAQVGASYEVDLFGRVSASVDAARADSERSEALFRSVQLALQADVAQHWFELRELDAEAEVLREGVTLREQALKLARSRHEAGDIGQEDVARAETELANVRTDALGVARQRAVVEHALAVLLGKAPAEFTAPAMPLQRVDLRIPAGLPSSLLERRPDIAAAERAMAAANARVGVAKAAFFPSLSLTGGLGYESGSLGNLFDWSSRTFLLGPLVGTALNIPLFDGGRRNGSLADAKARYEEDVADYREQVLVAFREVEDGLSDLRMLDEQISAQEIGARAAVQAARLAQVRYAGGDSSYLEVIDAERTVLQARRAAVQFEGQREFATVALIRSLGGGWGSEGPDVSATERGAAVVRHVMQVGDLAETAW